MRYLPEPVFGHRTVVTRCDGRFGTEDPTHWPQVFDISHKWMAAIPSHPPGHDDPRKILWHIPTQFDFVPIPSALNVVWGTIKPELRLALHEPVQHTYSYVQKLLKDKGPNPTVSQYANAMLNAYQLLEIPASFRDVVRQFACVQRHYLYTSACVNWYCHLLPRFKLPGPHPVFEGIIGAVTTDPVVVQNLFQIGVPVWYMRLADAVPPDTVVLSRPAFEKPNVPTSVGDFGETIFSGAMPKHLQPILLHGSRFLDIEHVPLNVNAFDIPSYVPDVTRNFTMASQSTSRKKPCRYPFIFFVFTTLLTTRDY